MPFVCPSVCSQCASITRGFIVPSFSFSCCSLLFLFSALCSLLPVALICWFAVASRGVNLRLRLSVASVPLSLSLFLSVTVYMWARPWPLTCVIRPSAHSLVSFISPLAVFGLVVVLLVSVSFLFLGFVLSPLSVPLMPRVVSLPYGASQGSLP